MPTTRVLYSIDLQKSSLFFHGWPDLFRRGISNRSSAVDLSLEIPLFGIRGRGDARSVCPLARGDLGERSIRSGVKTDQRVQRIRVQPEAGDTRQAGGLLVPAPEPVDIRHGKSGQGADVADDFQAKGEIGGEVP